MKKVIFANEEVIVCYNMSELMSECSFIGFQPREEYERYMLVSDGSYAVNGKVGLTHVKVNRLKDYIEGSVFVFSTKSELLEWMKG